MARSTIIKALGAVKDQTSISLAKVGSSNSLADLDVAIVKATRHGENPAEEKYIREILSLTCYSRAYVSACVNTLSRRLNKTRNWTVALKTLILIYRLLSEGDPSYEQEIFFATRRGTRLLNMSDFRDTSMSNSWDYSAFVRTFALYLDERLEFRMHRRRRGRRRSSMRDDLNDEEHDALPPVHSKSTPVREMKTERILTRMQHLQQLLERFLACRPTGLAKHDRMVMVALYPLVKESFQLYYDITEIMGILVDRFMEMEIPSCLKVCDIFSRISKQFDELELFYGWCKTVGIARSSDYPDVEKITQKKLDVMEEFIREKSALAQTRKARSQEPKQEPHVQKLPDDDLTVIKALPAPESSTELVAEVETNEETTTEDKNEEDETSKTTTQQEGDLLDLKDDSPCRDDQGDKLALALFDGEAAAQPAWEAFKPSEQEAADWETALVVSASNLSNQKATLGGGFDMLLLNGMYQQPPVANQSHAAAATGSASSVAFPGTTTPGMLALPAPPVSGSGGQAGDPFAASVAIPPPSYVQMSEMEKKQQLLVEEQLMWQQYARDGMQGHFHVAKPQQSPYHMGGLYR